MSNEKNNEAASVAQWTDDVDANAALLMLDRLDVSADDDVRVDAIAATIRRLAQAAPPATSAARDVLAERQRQISAEGWTPEHDDEHIPGTLSQAAGCYIEWNGYEQSVVPEGAIPINWPWAADWWKPKDERRNLVRAGALILAEIERLDRAEITPTITANSAANANRAQIVSRAVNAHGRKWPEQLTSGVMFYEGERITRDEFLAEVRR